MKNLIFVAALLASLSSFASISIVSDLDDTIKITDSGDTVDGTVSAVFKDKVFTGVTEFFLGTKDYTNELHVLSASPGILKPKIVATLNKRRIAFTSVILKNPLNRESKFDYKVKQIKRLMEANSDDFILIGDDVGQDPEAYGEIQRQFPNRVLAIYIHVINNREIPAGIKYWSTFDIALREYSKGRMLPGWVEKITQTLVEEKEMSMIIPSFADCPVNPTVWAWQLTSGFTKDALKISKKIIPHCLARRSGLPKVM